MSDDRLNPDTTFLIPVSSEPRTVEQIVEDMNQAAGSEVFQVLRGGIAPVLYGWQVAEND